MFHVVLAEAQIPLLILLGSWPPCNVTTYARWRGPVPAAARARRFAEHFSTWQARRSGRARAIWRMQAVHAQLCSRRARAFYVQDLASLLAILCRFCVVPRSCAAPASLQLHQSASRTCRPRPIGAAAGVALTALAVFGSPWLRWAAIPPHPPRLSFPSISISVYRWFSGGFLVPTVYLTFQLLPSVGGERPGGCGPERGSDAGNKRGYSHSAPRGRPTWEYSVRRRERAPGARCRPAALCLVRADAAGVDPGAL